LLCVYCVITLCSTSREIVEKIISYYLILHKSTSMSRGSFFILNGNRFYVLIVSKIGFIGITHILVFSRVVRGVHKIAIIKVVSASNNKAKVKLICRINNIVLFLICSLEILNSDT